MRCKDVRVWINEDHDRPDKAVVEHIINCSSCARAAEASRMLERLMASAREEESELSLADVRRCVESNANRQTRWQRFVTAITGGYVLRPGLLTGFSTAVVTLLFITLVPFSFDRTVSYSVSLEGADLHAAASSELITGALTAAGYENLALVLPEDEPAGNYAISGIPSEGEAVQIAAAIRTVVNDRVRVAVKPIVSRISCSIAAQVAERVKQEDAKPIRLRFEDGNLIIAETNLSALLKATDMTDEQVEVEIERLFAGQVVSEDVTVRSAVSYDGNARRALRLKMNVDSLGRLEPVLEILSDGDTLSFDDKIDTAGLPHRAILEIETLDGEHHESSLVLRLKLKDKDE